MVDRPSNYWIYRMSSNLTGLVTSVNSYLDNTKKPISGFLLMCNFNPFEIISKYENEINHEYKLKTLQRNDSIYSFILKRHIKRIDSKREIEGKAIISRTEKKNIYLVITDDSLDFLYNALKRFFEINYPRISLVYFSSYNLKATLDELTRLTGGEIIADKTVAYTRERGKISQVTYTSKSHIDVFSKAAEDDLWVDKIKFSLFEMNDERKLILNAFISRDGVFKCGNNFKTFYAIAIKNMISLADGLFNLYINRSRIEKDKISCSKPLSIKFNYPVFETVERNKNLIEAMEKMTYSSISVLHANPYLHITLSDFLDGSSYDIQVLSEDKITIIPQLKSTYSSLNRMIDTIFRRFGEGTVKNFEVELCNRES
ncbi:MAG: hypothetical protein V1648_03280 [Candidatus Aenigmatarchaeota archaeon]